jgi:hypothetical protein
MMTFISADSDADNVVNACGVATEDTNENIRYADIYVFLKVGVSCFNPFYNVTQRILYEEKHSIARLHAMFTLRVW